jgi:hypothetical protein
MCCSKATVRSHIANARIKMKRYFERRPRQVPREADSPDGNRQDAGNQDVNRRMP